MTGFLVSVLDYMKERFRSSFFVNISVVWMAIHWKVIYITLFVPSDDVFPIFWNKFDYVNSFMSNYEWYEDYFFPIVIGTFITIIKHPILMVIDKYVEEFKVKRHDLVDSINKTGNYQKLKDSENEVQSLRVYKENRSVFLFYGRWLVKWMEDGDEAKPEEYEYRFQLNDLNIDGHPINTTNKSIPYITISELVIIFPKSLSFIFKLKKNQNDVKPGGRYNNHFKCELDYASSNPDLLKGNMIPIHDGKISDKTSYTITMNRVS